MTSQKFHSIITRSDSGFGKTLSTYDDGIITETAVTLCYYIVEFL